MRVLYEKSFYKDIGLITDKSLKNKLLLIIEGITSAKSLSDVGAVKKMSGYSEYYRIRIGDFRLGIKYQEGNVITLIRFLHRKEIYKYFP